jgi:hypothetical protein
MLPKQHYLEMMVIRVTIELVPRGVESQAKVLHVAKIWNDGSGNLVRSNYKATLSTRGNRSIWKAVRVEGFQRKKLLAWDLLYRVLKMAVGERNG